MTTFVTFDQPETKKETNLSDQKLEFVSTSPGEEKGGKFETESGAGGMNLPVNINVSSPMVRYVVEWCQLQLVTGLMTIFLCTGSGWPRGGRRFDPGAPS